MQTTSGQYTLGMAQNGLAQKFKLTIPPSTGHTLIGMILQVVWHMMKIQK